MKVLEMKEREDGGAELQIDMTEDERCFMIEFGFNQLLRKIGRASCRERV
jgi:hypothetical protein